MARIRIDMPEFEKYIKLMNRIVNDICEENKVFANKVISYEDEWSDDVYKQARNQVFSMQAPTNNFISTLEELDEKLVTWYCNLYENYFDSTSYSRPAIDMGRVELVNDEIKRSDDKIDVNKEIIYEYIQSNQKYTTRIRELLGELFQAHVDFGEYFQSRRYDEISEELQRPKNAIEDILYLMDGLAEYEKHHIEPLKDD